MSEIVELLKQIDQMFPDESVFIKLFSDGAGYVGFLDENLGNEVTQDSFKNLEEAMLVLKKCLTPIEYNTCPNCGSDVEKPDRYCDGCHPALIMRDNRWD